MFSDTDADTASAGTAGVFPDEQAQSSVSAKTRITRSFFRMAVSILFQIMLASQHLGASSPIIVTIVGATFARP